MTGNQMGESWRIVLVFSDVNSSPLLIAILKQLQAKQISFRVILIGNPELNISQEMRVLNIPFIVIPKRSKYGALSLIFSVMKEFLRSKPKVVYTSGQYATITGILSAYILRVPRRIFTRHHSNLHHAYSMKFGIWIDRCANYLSTDIVAVSQIVKEILIDVENTSSNKITLIHNGINLNEFRQSELQTSQSQSIEKDPRRIINIGVISRLTEWKGVIYSVEAFIQLHLEFPNAHLHLIGAHADTFEQISNALAKIDSSRYTINEWGSDIPRFLNNLDIFIHVPIGPKEEAFGLVYVEALASGTSCIFTLSGVLHELPSITDYVEIVPYKDSEAIYSSMVKILNKSQPPKELVPQEWLEQFSMDVMADQYLNLMTAKDSHEF